MPTGRGAEVGGRGGGFGGKGGLAEGAKGVNSRSEHQRRLKENVGEVRVEQSEENHQLTRGGKRVNFSLGILGGRRWSVKLHLTKQL